MLTPTYSDAQIIEYLQKKDRKLIPSILDKYGDALYGIAYRKSQSELAASEILRLAFITIWNRASEYSEIEEPLFNWLLKIMNQTMANTHCQKAA